MDVTSFAVERDGRTIEALRAGPQGSTTLVFHNGTPSAAMLLPSVVEAAARHGLGTITFSRPGYGTSSPAHGRSVADNAALTAAVLDAAEAERFYTAGWSGGGPHALADIALLPDRCIAGVVLAGVAPFTAGIDWLAGMAAENVEEYQLASAGEAQLLPFLETFAKVLANVTGPDIVASLGGLVSEVDLDALSGEFSEAMAASMRGAVASGIAGWRDDDLAFVTPWGFDLAGIERPVAIWQGRNDNMVPFAHGEWLAANIAGAHPRLTPGDGHLTLVQSRIDEVIDDLVALS